jgi:hypothetical protein
VDPNEGVLQRSKMHQIYKDIWVWLNQTDLEAEPRHLTRDQLKLVFPAVLQSFKDDASSRTINLRTLSVADQNYLVSQGISPTSLFRNLRKTITGRHLDPLNFQLSAVKDKAVYASCPYTGKLVRSGHSLLANHHVMFYRFRSERVFYVITAGIGNGFKKSALYFPEQDLIVTAGDPWSFEEEDLVEFKARVVCDFEDCRKYLSEQNGADRRTAVCLGFYHFAHHLWNELSGLHRLFKRKLLGRVDKFFVLREPLGDIAQIFPEIPTDRIERKSDVSAVFKEVLRNNYFVVRVGGDFVAGDLARRVYRVAKQMCSTGTADKVRNTRRMHWPLLWVGIRVGSRTWSNQADGLAKIIDKLHRLFPGLGVVFDGFSLPADRLAEPSDRQEYKDILNQEDAVVGEVLERLRQSSRPMPGIINLIGGSILDAIVWAHAIDVYVSSHGSLQHKVGWLTNKPGIIHTNQTLLENPSAYIWAAAENGLRPRYVRPAAVDDVRDHRVETVIYREVREAQGKGWIQTGVKAVKGNPEFNNYKLDWEPLYEDLLDLIRSPKITFRLAPSTLVHKAKRKVKKTLRRVTSSLDPFKI